MTAYPQRVSLERVLGRATPPPASDRLQTRSWRVVQADGSKTALDGAAGEPNCPRDKTPAAPALFAAQAQHSGASEAATAPSTLGTRQRLINLATLGLLGGKHPPRATDGGAVAREGTAARPNISMPKASPTLSEPKRSADPADGLTGLPEAAGPERKVVASAVTAEPSQEPRKRASLPTVPECERDLQLLRVIDAWPALSPRAREAVVAVIEASSTR